MTDRRAGTGAVAEPIGKTQPARGKFDFSARSRATIHDAERYARFVNIMRRGLLLAGLLLIGLVVGYSLLPRQSQRMAMTFEKMGIVSGDLSMIKPKLHGADSDGNPFTITADKATQDPKNLRQAALTNVEADMSLKDGQWLTATAPHGLLDANARQLQLNGAIAVFTDQGYELHTDLAHIDLAKGVATGPHRVTGQGPSGTFVADRFRIERLTDPCARGKNNKNTGGQHKSKSHRQGGAAGVVCPVRAPNAPVKKTKPLIYLIGNVHMQIYPGAMKKKGMISRFNMALCALAIAISSGAAFAETTAGGIDMGKHDSSAPINVSADQFVGDLNTKVGTYIGNVIIVQGDFKLRADKVSVHEVNGKPSFIDGAGNVLFISTSGNASGDSGVYDLTSKNITLDGKVVLTKEKNVMRGTHLVMNIETGKAQLTAKGAQGGRVQGVFTPPAKGKPASPSQSQTTGKSPSN